MSDKRISGNKKKSLGESLNSIGPRFYGSDSTIDSKNPSRSASAKNLTQRSPAVGYQANRTGSVQSAKVAYSRLSSLANPNGTLSAEVSVLPRRGAFQFATLAELERSMNDLDNAVPLTLYQSFQQAWLRYLGMPPLPYPTTLTHPSLLAQEANQLSQQWEPTSTQLWPSALPVSTAIVVALPMMINTALVQSSIHFPAQPGNEVLKREASPSVNIAATATVSTTKANTTSPAATLTTPKTITTPLKFAKPTGKIANIQTYTLPATGAFTSGYGWRWGRLHRGIDIAGPVGTPVKASASGKVITAGWDDTGFGYMIEIKHPDGSTTLYGHNNRILTKVGALVRQGDQIAEMGSTGHSTGSHVHFEVHPGNKDAVDPQFFFPKGSLKNEG